MDRVLKERLISHLECEIKNGGKNKIYTVVGKKSYTYQDIIEEIQNDSEFAEKIVSDIISLTCYLLERDSLPMVTFKNEKMITCGQFMWEIIEPEKYKIILGDGLKGDEKQLVVKLYQGVLSIYDRSKGEDNEIIIKNNCSIEEATILLPKIMEANKLGLMINYSKESR